MPSLFDSLPMAKKTIAQEFISLLLALKPLANRFNDQINAYRERLEKCRSKDQYLGVLKEIVNKQKEIEMGLLKDEIEAMDSQLQSALKECIETNEKLLPLREALHINEALTDSLNSTQERLSMQALFSPLPQESREILEQFVINIHKLEPMVEHTQEKVKRYQERLAKITSLEEIDNIDREIETLSKRMASEYDTVITYPGDEESAGALIQFLQANQHIMQIMQSFDLHELLVDDLINARVRQGIN